MAERSKAPESGNYLYSESFLIWSFVARVRIPLPSTSNSMRVYFCFDSHGSSRVSSIQFSFRRKTKSTQGIACKVLLTVTTSSVSVYNMNAKELRSLFPLLVCSAGRVDKLQICRAEH